MKRVLIPVLIICMILLTIGCSNDQPKDQTEWAELDAEYLGLRFNYPKDWEIHNELVDGKAIVAGQADFSAGTVDKVQIYLLQNTIDLDSENTDALLQRIVEDVEHTILGDHKFDASNEQHDLYATDSMEVFKISLTLELDEDEPQPGQFRGNAKYFTYWLINHDSGNSYVIACSEQDRKQSCAATVEKIMESMEYLCESPAKEYQLPFEYYSFGKIVMEQYEGFV